MNRENRSSQTQVDIFSYNRSAAMDHPNNKTEVFPERLDNNNNDDCRNVNMNDNASSSSSSSRSSSSSCSSDEEHDKLSNIHNFRRDNPHVEPATDPTASIRRVDSWTSFITRSERNILLGKDNPPSEDEASKRKVKFVHDDQLETVHEVETVPDDIKKQYWMNGSDFDRLDKEVALTKFRWENHKSGKIQFDEEANSLRGLEHVLEVDSDKNLKRWQHIRTVLQEINRQRENNPVAEIDWEKVRQASLASSKMFHEHAVAMGRKDEEAKERAWNGNQAKTVPPGNIDESKNNKSPRNKPKDKSKRRGFMFWKK